MSIVNTIIHYVDSETVEFQPFPVGIFSTSFQEYVLPIHEENTISNCLSFKHRFTTVFVTGLNTILDNSSPTASDVYYFYACFKNKQVEKIGMCLDGNVPSDYNYYMRINKSFTLNGSAEIASFSDITIYNNMEL